MAFALKLRKLAIKDLGEAYDWYEKQKPDLGGRVFVECPGCTTKHPAKS